MNTHRPHSHHRQRAVSRMAVSSALAVAMLLSQSQSAAQSTTQITAPPPSFRDSFEPYLPSTAPDLRIPPSAVDLETFEPKREKREPLGGKTVRNLGTGVASYYGKRFHGRRTANGERFNMRAMTAAHKSLPFGTKVRVINARNGRAVVVRINDRGPFIRGRTIDLSRAAAKKIGLISTGHARVKLQIVQ